MGKVVILGLDGFDPQLAQRWMDADFLPHLASLRGRGAFLPCASTRPPVTYPAWTTCVTGLNPGRHGIFDFTEMARGHYGFHFVNSSHRRAPALWNMLSAAGRRCCVLGVPGTYPPEAINGVMLSGFDSPVATGVDASFVYPRERFGQLRAWRFADFQESHIGPGWHAMALRKLLDKIAVKEGIALELYREEPWDFFMVVFGESDTVSHHFWMYHDPASPRHQSGFEDAILQVYQRLDATVGKFLSTLHPDTLVLVVSDHGFGGAGTGVVHLNNWLAERGYLAFSGEGGSALKGIALRAVPASWRGALFRRLRTMAESAESKSRCGGIAWPHTRAWSEELNYFPTIRVNLAGREPGGTVAAEDYDCFVQQLCAELEAWEVPGADGPHRPVARAFPRAAIYHGAEVHRAADIIIELALENGYSHSCLRSRGGAAFRRLRPEEYPGGKERGMNGAHRDPGVLWLSKAPARREASLLDVAPTVLAAMGVDGPPMEGAPLLGDAPAAFTQSPDWMPEEYAYTPEEAAALEARMRALGYYE
jgi:predicted AlkP superfamily phosphohydrolase/phosphomutase